MTTGLDRSQAPVVPLNRYREWLVVVRAAVAAAAAGLLLLLAFPPFDRWWAAPIGVALLATVTRRRRVWAGAALGAVTGLTLFVPLLSFTGLQVGWWPWLPLAALQASFVALLGAAAAVAGELVERVGWCWPVLTGLLWVSQEALRSRIPFGGFPWGRLAFSQADAPTIRFAAFGGAPLVTFAVALAGGLLAVAMWRLTTPRPVRRHAVGAGVATLAALAVTSFGAALPAVGTDRSTGGGGGRPRERAAHGPGLQRPTPRGPGQPRRGHPPAGRCRPRRA